MARLIVFGNSGSGKSTWALAQAVADACPHLDLDTVAWLSGSTTPVRLPLRESWDAIAAFIAMNDHWVIEGCYTDLLDFAARSATEMVFLNPGTDVCVANARSRPWEPHKYSSPAAQERNLQMLIDWITQYEHRTDEFSLAAHRRLYDNFRGSKREFLSNARDRDGSSRPETGAAGAA